MPGNPKQAARTLHFLMRYSDNLRGVDTIAEHMDLLKRKKSVWFGKFGLGMNTAVTSKRWRSFLATMRASTAWACVIRLMCSMSALSGAPPDRPKGDAVIECSGGVYYWVEVPSDD